jgi:Protein of unknown function (DUF1648)
MTTTPKKSIWMGLLAVAMLSAAAFAYVFVTSASLPDVAATHFNVRGEPNALTSRNSYRGFMALLIVVIPLTLAGLPVVFARRWPQLLNIPNREHWLSPERIEATLSSLGARTALLAAATIGLQCFVHRLVLAANAADRPELDQRTLLIGLGIFAAFMIGWIVSLYRRFRRP